MKSGGYQTELLRSLPLLALFTVSWAVGYWRGDGGAFARVC